MNAVMLGVESTFNNCCVCVMSSDATVHYEASETFQAAPELVQDSAPWRRSLERFHATTLPRLLSPALRNAGRLDGVAVSVVEGKANANADVARRVVAEVAVAENLPVVEVDHHEAHLLAALLCRPAPRFPYIGLTAAGGHCNIKLALALGDYATLGSHDSVARNRFGHGRAPGSVLDRCSELLGIAAPGQPDGAIAIDRLSRTRDDWSYHRFPVTERLNRDNGYNIDLHALYEEVAVALSAEAAGIDRLTLAVSAQECVMNILLDKALAAATTHSAPRIAFGGGVAANSRLRSLAGHRAAQATVRLYFPPREVCVDNARMIAFAALLRTAPGVEGAQCESL